MEMLTQQFTVLRSLLAAGALAGVAIAQSIPPSAASLSVKPLKIDIESQKTWQMLGEKAAYNVVLKDAYNKPAKAQKATPIVVSCINAAGAVVQQAELQINKGESKTAWACDAKQTGPLRVEAKQKNGELLGGKSLIYVTPPAKAPVAPRGVAPKTQKQRGSLLQPGVRLLAVAQIDSPPPTPGTFGVQLLGSETEALANGTSEGHFQVCFTQGDPDHPRTIVLYSHDGGTSNSSLEIPANEPCGAATVTSRTPGKVLVRIVSAAVGRLGAAAIDPPNRLTFTFHKVIADLRLENPRPSMSLIESEEFVARFYDADNRVTSAGEERTVTFHLQGAGLIQPEPVTVSSNATEARTSFFPTSWGPAQLSAATNALAPTTPKTIMVSVWLVFILAIAGGAIGALISYAQFKDVLWWRVFVGVVTGLFLLWMASSGFVAQLSPSVVRTNVSGFFLALAGGYAGLTVVDWFLKLVHLGGVRSPAGP